MVVVVEMVLIAVAFDSAGPVLMLPLEVAVETIEVKAMPCFVEESVEEVAGEIVVVDVRRMGMIVGSLPANGKPDHKRSKSQPSTHLY